VTTAWSPGTEEDVRQAEDRLLGAGEDEDVVRSDAVVQRRDLCSQERMARGLGVAEAEVVPQVATLGVGEGEEVGHRVALDVRCAQEVADRKLPAGEEPFESELGDAHEPMMAEFVGR